MKYLFAALLAIFFSVNTIYSQSLSISKVQKFNSKKDLFTIGGWVQDNLMVFYTEKSKSYVDLYDAEMNRKAIVSLNFMPDAPKQVQLLPQKAQALLIYSAQINNKEFYYAARIDKDGRIKGRPKSIDTAFQNFFGGTKLNYQFIHSSTNDKVGVFSYRIKDSKLDFQITIVDDSLDIIHSSTQTVPIKNFYDVSQIVLKENGTVVVLATDVSTNKNEEVAEAISYIIQPIDKKKADVKAFNFDFGDVFVSNLYLKEDIVQNNFMYFAGLSKSKMGSIDGVFSGKINLDDANNTIINGNVLKFDNNFNSVAANDKGIIRNFVVQDIVVKNDGGMLLVAEAFAKVIRSNYNSPGFYGYGYGGMSTSRYVEYYYGNILVLDLDANKVLNWHSTIPKLQSSTDDYGTYSSYVMLNTGNNLAFIYNEFLNKGYKVNANAISTNGQQENLEITTQMKGDGKWIPKLGMQTKAKELLVPVLGNNKLQFVKVNF